MLYIVAGDWLDLNSNEKVKWWRYFTFQVIIHHMWPDQIVRPSILRQSAGLPDMTPSFDTCASRMSTSSSSRNTPSPGSEKSERSNVAEAILVSHLFLSPSAEPKIVANHWCCIHFFPAISRQRVCLKNSILNIVIPTNMTAVGCGVSP